MSTLQQVLRILDESLQLQGRGIRFSADSPLLGSLPEFDSMAVLALIAGLESHFGVTFSDETLSGECFATVASVCDLVDQTLAAESP